MAVNVALRTGSTVTAAASADRLPRLVLGRCASLHGESVGRGDSLHCRSMFASALVNLYTNDIEAGLRFGVQGSTTSSSTSAGWGAPLALPATHQSAPGSPADAYARDPGSWFWYESRARATTSPCAGSHRRAEPSSSEASTTASYHLHTATSAPLGPVATATRWPGDTRLPRTSERVRSPWAAQCAGPSDLGQPGDLPVDLEVDPLQGG